MGGERKPFHESVVDTIRYVVESTGMSEMALLAKLIKETDIPKGHDDILATWNQLRSQHGYPEGSVDVYDVIADVRAQKDDAAAKEAAKAAGATAGKTAS